MTKYFPKTNQHEWGLNICSDLDCLLMPWMFSDILAVKQLVQIHTVSDYQNTHVKIDRKVLVPPLHKWEN